MKHWYVDMQLALIRRGAADLTAERRAELDCEAKTYRFEDYCALIKEGLCTAPVAVAGKYIATSMLMWLYLAERHDDLEAVLAVMGAEVEAAGLTKETTELIIREAEIDHNRQLQS